MMSRSSLLVLALDVSTRLERLGPSRCLSYFEKQIGPYEKKPVFVAAGPAFDAADCMKGKPILSIPVSSADPFTANIEKATMATCRSTTRRRARC